MQTKQSVKFCSYCEREVPLEEFRLVRGTMLSENCHPCEKEIINISNYLTGKSCIKLSNIIMVMQEQEKKRTKYQKPKEKDVKNYSDYIAEQNYKEDKIKSEKINKILRYKS